MDWRFKKWDVRSDGMVFWRYHKDLTDGQYWVTWDKALKLKDAYKNNQKYKDRKKIYNKKWRESESGRAYKNAHQRAYNHLPKYRAYQREYDRLHRGKYRKKKYESDPIFGEICRIRSRMAKIIRQSGYSKKCKANEIIGCSKEEFETHLESKFTKGMSWENRSMWHVDHIIPLASAKSVEELYKLNHYTNLQPLWAKDNMKKGKKINTIKE